VQHNIYRQKQPHTIGTTKRHNFKPFEFTLVQFWVSDIVPDTSMGHDGFIMNLQKLIDSATVQILPF